MKIWHNGRTKSLKSALIHCKQCVRSQQGTSPLAEGLPLCRVLREPSNDMYKMRLMKTERREWRFFIYRRL